MELNWLWKHIKKVRSSQPAIIVLNWIKYKFSLWVSLTSNVNKDIEKVFICFVGVFNFFNVIPISVVQSIFKFVKIFSALTAFVGRFYDWSLHCFIGFNCEDNRKMIWQVSFYYGWLNVIGVCYTIGDNVVYGIGWVAGYPCWLFWQRNHITAKHEIEKVLHVFICFKI